MKRDIYSTMNLLITVVFMFGGELFISRYNLQTYMPFLPFVWLLSMWGVSMAFIRAINKINE